MLTVETPQDLLAHVGATLGATDWRLIPQAEISAFAALTGDDHWIHVDEARASRDMPDGRTIAHGLYLLALVPRMQRDLFHIARRGAGLNYGYDRVRFTAPVPSGSRVRLRQTLVAAEPQGTGARLTIESVFEIEGQEKPALIARGILLVAGAQGSV